MIASPRLSIRQTFNEGLIAIVVRVLGRLTNLLLQMYVARQLSLADYGIFALAWLWIYTCTYLGTLGLDLVPTKFIPNYRSADDFESEASLLRWANRRLLLGSTALLISGFSVMAVTASAKLHVAVYASVAGASLSAAWLYYYAAILRARSRSIAAAVLTEVVPTGISLAVVVLLGMRASTAIAEALTALFIGYAIAWAIGRIMIGHQFGSSWSIWPHADRSKWRYTANTVLMSAILTFAATTFPGLYLSPALGSEAVGKFQAANQIASLMSFVIVATNMVIAERVSRLWGQGNKLDVARIIRSNMTLTVSAASVILAAVLVIPQQILAIYGASFAPAAGTMIVLAAGQYISALLGPVSLLLVLTGHPKRSLLSVAISAVVSVLALVALVPVYGLLAAGGAIALGMVVGRLYAATQLYRLTGIDSTVMQFIPRREKR